MEKVGTVTDIKLQISGMWYKAYVTYDNKSTVDSQFKDRWSLFYLKDLCRVAPVTATRQEIEERNRNTLKLAGLPFGTTAYDLSKVLKKVEAKTCFIPRTRNQYGRARYAYVTFNNEEICNKLLNNELAVTINEAILGWVGPDDKTCYKCGNYGHLVMDCHEKKDNDEFKQRRQGYNRVYTRYRVPNYRNITKPSQKPTMLTEKTKDNNFNQHMLDSLNAIQQSIKEMNATLHYLNQRITKIEKQVGIKILTQMNIGQNSNENDSNIIITTQQTTT